MPILVIELMNNMRSKIVQALNKPINNSDRIKIREQITKVTITK
jgi:hypothetical protein